MSSLLKKHAFSLPIERHFTREGVDAFELIHFRTPENEDAPECPDNWSDEAARVLAEEAARVSVPAALRAVEENTVPSWLWRHVAATPVRDNETSVRPIFQRAVGAATYTAWKEGVLGGEAETRAFFDEARYMLAQRFIAFEPRVLSLAGLSWAYGIAAERDEDEGAPPQSAAITGVRNATIDGVLAGEREMSHNWKKLLTGGVRRGALALHFTDIATDWEKFHAAAPHGVIDLLAFRREDGAVHIERLRHAVKIAVTLLDLLGHRDALALGLVNLAPLLMAQNMPYDSDAARATAAALAAIVTAEAYLISAKLAALRGVAPAFLADAQTMLRHLRNHRRAAYGDTTDYEKISVLPTPLKLEQGADLPLIAAARTGWDEALAEARQHGLRHVQVTSLAASPTLALFLETSADALAPLDQLTTLRPTEAGTYRREINAAVTEALTKLGYKSDARRAIIQHIAGAKTLHGAPAINPDTLRARGFDDAALARVEDYLPHAENLRSAFTPYVVGAEFCRSALKIAETKIHDPHFDLLRHVGFTAAEISTADRWCFGHSRATDAPHLRAEDRNIFTHGAAISADARIRMAAVVQSFISGDAALSLTVPAETGATGSAALALAAWRQGVKSVRILYDAAPGHAAEDRPAAAFKRQSAAAPLHETKPALAARRAKPKAAARVVALKRGAEKSPGAGKRG